MTAFSIRHRRALSEERIHVDLEPRVRGRLRRLLWKHSDSWHESDETGFNYRTDSLEQLTSELCDAYGRDTLTGTTNYEDLKQFLKEGAAEGVFDAIELVLSHLPEPAAFTSELNDVLAEEEVPWRLLDGRMVLLDRVFARDELASRANVAIETQGFEGAGVEMQQARDAIIDGDGRGAIHRSGNALESVMQALLGREHGAAKALLQHLVRGGYFDDLPDRLRQPFVAKVMDALPWMRNHLGGHGQGEKPVEVPQPYAELAADLASSISYFLISLRLQRDAPEGDLHTEKTVDDVKAAEAVSVAAGQDDIPF
jgi:hypothetical protein